MDTEFEHIVVGAGIQGSWTAYQLARLGRKTLLLEQFPIPHTRGSSHGATRIIRKAYPEDYQAALMDDAYQQWYQLEKDSGMTLFRHAGMLAVADPTVYKKLDKLIRNLQKVGSKHEVLDATELKTRFPGLSFTHNHRALVENHAGILMADKSLAAVQTLFKKLGGVIQDSVLVEAIDPGERVLVRGEDRIFSAKSVVVCAGPWTDRLLKPIGLDLPLRVVKIPVYYWKVKDPGCMSTSFIDLNDTQNVYAIPPCEYPDCAKVCLHDGPVITPNERDQVDTQHIRQKMSVYVRQHFPGLEPQPAIEEACMYTITPDSICILDRHPKYKNIVFGCGFSGMGFKLGPVVGQILADLAIGRPTKHDITPFRLKRFKEEELKAKL